MIRKDLILFFFLGSLTLLSVSSLFYRSIILEDFEIIVSEDESSEE